MSEYMCRECGETYKGALAVCGACDGGPVVKAVSEPAKPPDGGPARDKSLRAWFAGQCDPTPYNPLESCTTQLKHEPNTEELATFVAMVRCAEADAMLVELAKGGGR